MQCRAPRWAHSTDPRHDVEQRGYDLIGSTIKEFRTAAGLTQRQLEDLTGIDQTVISRLENGRQYGLRWSRYAILIAVLDEHQPEKTKPIPWWVQIGYTPLSLRDQQAADDGDDDDEDEDPDPLDALE